MPVVAVIGGIATAAGAAGGAAALVGGTITLSTVASGLAFVGGVASALGGITGNKKLMKFGMIAGLGGAALGGLNSLMSTAADTASAGASAATAATSSADALTNPLAVTGGGLNESTGLLGLGESASALPKAFDPNALRLTNTAVQAAPAAVVAPPVVAPPSGLGAGAPVAPGNLAANMAQRGEVTLPGADGTTSVMGKATGALKGFGNLMNENKGLATVGMGMLSAYGQAKSAQAQMDAQLEADEARRARLNASIQNQVRA